MTTIKKILFALGMLPLIWLIDAAWHDLLGANPIERAIRFTGDWALWLLLISLSVTPLRQLPGLSGLIRVRRMLGLFCFFYAILHLMGYVALDRYFDWNVLMKDLIKRPYILMGASAFLLLLPLAVTSTNGWMKRLGRNWKRLHRLVYVAATLAIVHYWLMVKADRLLPAVHGVALAILMAWRMAQTANERQSMHA
ncbi:MAG: sulfoxide reductase heme-binding subunit YedZ [Magnetococcales bacterium]|nr:sulfoxide reductase heme-binding subunit YedZ [Magnetococcales bacterium]